MKITYTETVTSGQQTITKTATVEVDNMEIEGVVLALRLAVNRCLNAVEFARATE